MCVWVCVLCGVFVWCMGDVCMCVGGWWVCVWWVVWCMFVCGCVVCGVCVWACVCVRVVCVCVCGLCVSAVKAEILSTADFDPSEVIQCRTVHFSFN